MVPQNWIHHVEKVVEGRVAAPDVRRTAKFSTKNNKDLMICIYPKTVVHVLSILWTADTVFPMTFSTVGSTGAHRGGVTR